MNRLVMNGTFENCRARAVAITFATVFGFLLLTAMPAWADDCGSNTYDPTSEGCCSMTIYDLGTQDCCADGQVVDKGNCGGGGGGDNDGDGIQDDLDPDDDNDGYTDEEETTAGTNPNDPADNPGNGGGGWGDGLVDCFDGHYIVGRYDPRYEQCCYVGAGIHVVLPLDVPCPAWCGVGPQGGGGWLGPGEECCEGLVGPAGTCFPMCGEVEYYPPLQDCCNGFIYTVGSQECCDAEEIVPAGECELSVTITPSEDKVIAKNTSVSFNATPKGGKAPYTYEWTFDNGTPASASSQSVDVTFGDAAEGGGNSCSVAVTDARGNTASAGVTVNVPAIKLNQTEISPNGNYRTYNNAPQIGNASNLFAVWPDEKITIKIIMGSPLDQAENLPPHFVKWEAPGHTIPDNSLEYTFSWSSGVNEVKISIRDSVYRVHIHIPYVGFFSQLEAAALCPVTAPIMIFNRSLVLAYVDAAHTIGGPRHDAMRHALWCSLSVSTFSVNAGDVWLISTAHEHDNYSQGQPAFDSSMDLHNNTVGMSVVHRDGLVPDVDAIITDLEQKYDSGVMFIWETSGSSPETPEDFVEGILTNSDRSRIY